MTDQAMQARIDAAIDRAIGERLVGAVVMVAKGGETVYRRGAGLADREAGVPMREDTIFRYASLTKPLVSAAAMSLIEQGRLSLDDAAAKWLPTFMPKDPFGAPATITIRQLLTHTAGLSYAGLQAPGSAYEHAGVSDGLDEKFFSMDEEIARLSGVPLPFVPGTIWSYGVAVDVLGAVLEKVEGKPLGEIVRERVTGPLGMTDTAFFVEDASRLAKPYHGVSPPQPMSDPQVVPFVPGGAGLRFSPSRILSKAAFPSGGGGMAGTAGDFMKFLTAIRAGGGPILKRETVEAMTANQIGELRVTLDPSLTSGFGFGGSVLMDPAKIMSPMSQGTWRWGGVYGHHWYFDRAKDITVVCLTNTTLEGMMGPSIVDLMWAVYGT